MEKDIAKMLEKELKKASEFMAKINKPLKEMQEELEKEVGVPLEDFDKLSKQEFDKHIDKMVEIVNKYVDNIDFKDEDREDEEEEDNDKVVFKIESVGKGQVSVEVSGSTPSQVLKLVGVSMAHYIKSVAKKGREDRVLEDFIEVIKEEM